MQPDIRQRLPIQLKRRFDSLGAYVRTTIIAIEKEKEIPKKKRINKEDMSNISLLVFVFSLRTFLFEGTRAAKSAAQSTVDLGLSGFQVGSQVFEPENDNTLRGERLAETLWRSIEDQRILNIMESESTLHGLVEKLYAITRKPKLLDKYSRTKGTSR